MTSEKNVCISFLLVRYIRKELTADGEYPNVVSMVCKESRIGIERFVKESCIPNRKLRSSYPCAGAQGVRRAEFPLRTLGSQRSLADSLTALLHGETTASPAPFADPPFIPA